MAASAAPAPLREPHRARRTEISLGLTQGALALDGHEVTEPVVLPEAAHLRRGDLFGAGQPGRDEGEPGVEGVEPTEAIVLPVGEPVIGPGLTEARTRLGLTVDQLAERTRIRPHVIESIEHDDFAACGGDFYARGHLRTLARVLGLDAAPLLTSYDEHYAVGPVSPRRVFEAELGRGTVRDLQGSRSGPTWSVLVAAVMAVVLAWSVARLVMDGPVPVDPTPGLGSDSGGVGGARPAGDAVPVLLRAPDGGARVVVRDGNGRIAFTGDLAFGASHSLSAIPPVRVESTDGSVEVVVNGQDHGALGDTGSPTSRVFDGR
jgi:transcriptional regulator with XRE-family HTH domain